MSVFFRRLIWCWGGLLSLILIWGVLPLANISQSGMTLLVVLVTVVACWELTRRSHRLKAKIELTVIPILPPEGFDGGLVLVCGDGSALLFDGSSTCREVRQGWYLATPTTEDFLHTVQWIANYHPAWLPRIAVMLSIAPELHTDEAHFRGGMHQWRVAINQSRSWLPSIPPVILCGYLNHNGATDVLQEPLWFAEVDKTTGMAVWGSDYKAQSYAYWMKDSTDKETSERFMQGVSINAYVNWLIKVVLDEFHCTKTLLPVLPISQWVVSLTRVAGVENNLWQQQINEQTTLRIPVSSATASLPFPDPFLFLLPRHQEVLPLQRFIYRSMILLAVFFVVALLVSFVNNQRSIRSVIDDLRHYKSFDGTAPEPKRIAQQRLREDEQLLARYQRQGAPLSLGLGLYQGAVLYPVVQQAVSDWVAPKPLPVTLQDEPKTVRLDSLSLFDVGKYHLKTSSTKVLVEALFGIKAKPGWLIVVAGHSDTTGDKKANQLLSLKRAEAVRDWMLQTSDVSPTCFAVQGYGDTQPIASNENDQGRAANRRVEISLVPQANACQGPDSIMPPQYVDGFNHQGE